LKKFFIQTVTSQYSAGASLPESGQYIPGVHDWQSSKAVLFVLGEK